MSAIPPPYVQREPNQVPAQPAITPVIPLTTGTAPLEFAETTSVCLEWKVSGLKAMYEASRGEAKSRCVKSAVFGDADNLWEVLWYPNSGVAGGEYASLYLSCVPTTQERDQGINNKWTRKGLWWFRFEIKSTIPDERTQKFPTLATKDASDHTFAVKTANWGWQQFTKRDALFLHPAVVLTDGFTIVCTIQAQAQPPAGCWLGLGLPVGGNWVGGNTVVAGKNVGSGGGLSAWAGGEGAGGGVAGGIAAGGGVKRVVPRDLVSAVGSLLDDQLYSDVEFVFPAKSIRHRAGTEVDQPSSQSSTKRVFANKKMLVRCEYFDSMFNGGFREVEGAIEDYEDEDDLDTLSDSDVEDEADESTFEPPPSSAHLSQPTSRLSDPVPPAARRFSTSADITEHEPDHPDRPSSQEPLDDIPETGQGHHGEGSGIEVEDENMEDEQGGITPKRGEVVGGSSNRVEGPSGALIGPKKTKVVIRDAAWSTWWAVLYWLYTDIIYFAPLTSTFDHPPIPAPQTHSRSGSLANSGFAQPPEPSTRQEWISQWMSEHGVGEDTQGPRPVSAKAVYRLADKLDLPSLRIRAFQHIVAGLTAQNIPAEVFSRFSSTFEEVRKVQVAFFLKNWSEIKKSETMTQIWQQIRLGKHVGFEEVWPLIVGQLDFKAS